MHASFISVRHDTLGMEIYNLGNSTYLPANILTEGRHFSYFHVMYHVK
jgi:hypothetical protein